MQTGRQQTTHTPSWQSYPGPILGLRGLTCQWYEAWRGGGKQGKRWRRHTYRGAQKDSRGICLIPQRAVYVSLCLSFGDVRRAE
jgi:hypothetical protein